MTCYIFYNDLNHCMSLMSQMLESNLVLWLFLEEKKINEALFFFSSVAFKLLPFVSQCTKYSISFQIFLNIWKTKILDIFRYLEHSLYLELFHRSGKRMPAVITNPIWETLLIAMFCIIGSLVKYAWTSTLIFTYLIIRGNLYQYENYRTLT